MEEKTKTYVVKEGEWTEWIQPTEFYEWICCSCDFSHIIQFRIKNKKIQFRVKENKGPKKDKAFSGSGD